ncbi:MAG: DNA primase [Pseudomonadales bacterium]
MVGRIPQSFINELLSRIDIVDVVDGRVALRKAGRDYQGLCPFHNEKTPSFTVAPQKQFYHCFGCGASGTALTFLMEFERLEFVEAVETLARMAGIEVPREAGVRRDESHEPIFKALARAEQFFREQLKSSASAVDYLRQRGVVGVVARDFAIGFAPDGWDGLRRALTDIPEARLLEAGLLTRNDSGRIYDRFRGRVMFPIRDTRGRVIGFGGRVFGATEGPKYLNSPETPVFHKGRELYGLYEVRRALRQIHSLIVVEGYMDVVALAQSGVANAVATLGTAATPEHFHKLYRYTEEVVCCFDGDNAGRKAAWRALESALPELKEGRQLKFMFLPEGEDPDSLVRARGKDAFLRLAAEATPAIEYLFSRLVDGLDLRSLDDRARLGSLALPHIERVPAGILKELMRARLSELTGLSPSEVVADRVRIGGAAVSASLGSVASSGVIQPRSGEPTRADPRLAVGGPLQRRLLAQLLRRPALLLTLPPLLRESLCSQQTSDLFIEVVRFLDTRPEADVADILGRWAGTQAHARLIELVTTSFVLDDHALQGEFMAGVSKLLETFARAERRRLLAELRESSSADTFREFWTQRRGASDADDGGADV